jgi:hypothetical protein
MYITTKDSVVHLLSSVFEATLETLFKDLKFILSREIWVTAGSFCDIGSEVIARFLLALYKTYSI